MLSLSPTCKTYPRGDAPSKSRAILKQNHDSRNRIPQLLSVDNRDGQSMTGSRTRTSSTNAVNIEPMNSEHRPIMRQFFAWYSGPSSVNTTTGQAAERARSLGQSGPTTETL